MTGLGYGELPPLRRDELPGHVTMVFDGRCGMCTRSARYLAWLAGSGPIGSPDPRVDVLASQAPGVLDRLDLGADDAARAVWTIGGEPRIAVGGPRSIALAIAVGRRSTLPLLPLRLLPVAWLLDAIYGWIAEHRSWFPGELPWCEAHPGRCP